MDRLPLELAQQILSYLDDERKHGEALAFDYKAKPRRDFAHQPMFTTRPRPMAREAIRDVLNVRQVNRKFRAASWKLLAKVINHVPFPFTREGLEMLCEVGRCEFIQEYIREITIGLVRLMHTPLSSVQRDHNIHKLSITLSRFSNLKEIRLAMCEDLVCSYHQGSRDAWSRQPGDEVCGFQSLDADFAGKSQVLSMFFSALHASKREIQTLMTVQRDRARESDGHHLSLNALVSIPNPVLRSCMASITALALHINDFTMADWTQLAAVLPRLQELELRPQFHLQSRDFVRHLWSSDARFPRLRSLWLSVTTERAWRIPDNFPGDDPPAFLLRHKRTLRTLSLVGFGSYMRDDNFDRLKAFLAEHLQLDLLRVKAIREPAGRGDREYWSDPVSAFFRTQDGGVPKEEPAAKHVIACVTGASNPITEHRVEFQDGEWTVSRLERAPLDPEDVIFF